MKLRVPAFAVLFALMATSTFAHGNKKHIMGTLEKISADSVVVKLSDGKSVEVKLVSATAYVLRVGQEDKPAKASDLTVGARVAIHATPKGDTLEADEIKFAKPGAAAATPAFAKTKP